LYCWMLVLAGLTLTDLLMDGSVQVPIAKNLLGQRATGWERNQITLYGE
jgi:hypothetical protein